MLKRFATRAVLLGALGIGLLLGGFAVAGATAPAAHAWGCFGWNGIFIHAQWCNGYGYGGNPGYGYGGYSGYPPPPPPYNPYGGCGCRY